MNINGVAFLFNFNPTCHLKLQMVDIFFKGSPGHLSLENLMGSNFKWHVGLKVNKKKPHRLNSCDNESKLMKP